MGQSNAITVISATGDLNFLAEPIGVSLERFKEFNFAEAASWSHIELYAVAVGMEINIEFVKAIEVMSYYYPVLHDILTAELKTSNELDAFANTIEFAECVFKVWNDTKYYGVWSEISEQVSTYGLEPPDAGAWDWDEDVKTRRKYEILSVLDAKFPYLLVKFYALRAKDIHSQDKRFMLWLRRRIAVKAATDKTMARVLHAMDEDISKMNRIAMFMS